MQAITTKYLGCTNNRPSRIVARAEVRRKTVAWDYNLDVEGNHKAAAMALVKDLGWDRDGSSWVHGGLPDQSGYAFVCVGRHEAIEIGKAARKATRKLRKAT